ncbi:MAG: MMPL family transporter [Nitrospirota bacterium]
MQNIRDRIELRFSNFGYIVNRRPWLFILGSLLVVASLVSQLPHIIVDTSAEGLLHKKNPALVTYESFRQQFGRDTMAIAAIDSGNVFNAAFLRKLQEFHSALEEEVPFLDEVTSLVNADHIYGESDDLIVEDLLESLPENEAEMKDLKSRVLSNPLYRNVLVSGDGSFTVVIIKPLLLSPAGKDLSSNTSSQKLSEKEVTAFVDSIRKVISRFHSPDFPIHLGGDTTVEEVLKGMTVSTMMRFTGYTTLVIIIIFAFLFRRISGVLIPLVVVNFALYSTLGLMAAFRVPITLNTTILPSFLLAVGIGDSVHILAIYYRHLRKHGNRSEAISFALGHSGLAVLMTSLTTAGGLLSFVTSGIEPVTNLGIFAAIGVMLALGFTLVTLPALLSVTPQKKQKPYTDDTSLSKLDNMLAAIGDFATRYPWRVVIVSCCLFLGALLLALQLRFTHNSLIYLKKDVPVRVATELIDDKMNGSIGVEFLIDTGKPYGLYEPEVMKKIEEAQHLAEEMVIEGRKVGRASAVADIIKEINQALHGGKIDEYRIPGDRELIAQELLLYEVGGGENLEKFIDREYRRARISVIVPWVDAVAYNHVLYDFEQKMRGLFAGHATVTLTGMAAIIMRTLASIIRSMSESYLIAGCVISILMILLIGNVRLGLCSMGPNFFPIVLGLGLMKLTGIPLDYSTIMVGGIAIGLAVDDTVHFMHNFRRYHDKCGDAREAVRRTLTTSGRAMLFTTIILAAGFFILLFAELKSTFNFGLITGFTICMALVADFLLAPAMMVLLTKKD